MAKIVSIAPVSDNEATAETVNSIARRYGALRQASKAPT